MLAFYLKRTIHSLGRTPGLSSVMIINMALGLAIWLIAYAAVESQRRVPLRDAETLFHVDWGGAPASDVSELESYQRIHAFVPHLLLSAGDADRLATHAAVTRHAKTFTSRLTARTPRGSALTAVRFSTRELFSMFELPFSHGGAWSLPAERGQDAQVVLDHASNARFFKGEDSVGRALEIDGRRFIVTGVLAATPERLRAYDLSFSVAPAIYLPFEWARVLGARPDYVARRGSHGQTVATLDGQDGFVQLWVDLSPGLRAEYEAFVAAAARGVRQLGAGRRPRLQTPSEFLEYSVPIANGFFMFRACAFIALLACGVNLSRLLIVKFQARAPELAVQRALGATRRSVFAQHMLEAVVVASAAIALALLITVLGLLGINAIMPDRPSAFTLDRWGVLLGCSVGLAAGLLAGIHPAIRMCRSAPATFLRLQ
jgi:putative ABC transport system permease protein